MIDEKAIIAALLAKFPSDITLDQIGEEIGIRAVTPPQIEAIIDTLEKKGRRVLTPPGGNGEANLKKVLAARRELGKASVSDLAAHTGLSEEQIRQALELAKVMQR